MGVVRAGAVVVAAGLASASGAAAANPRLDASGFVGMAWFGANELGNSWAAEQAPSTAPLVGARVRWLALPALPAQLQLAVEAELAFAPAQTGDSADRGRRSYFAPVLAWRAHALLRLTRWREIAPHVVLGAGGETVASSSPFMSKETDPVAYWGVGADVPLSPRWFARFDVRHGVMAARADGVTSTFELQMGVGATFGGGGGVTRRAVASETTETAPAPERTPDRAAPVRDEARGDQAADPDGDGVAGAADACPDAPEDHDGFEDGDGCPDPDNDRDGIPDAADRCPDDPETRNGITDDDGCPDALPAEVSAALATQLRFEPGRARVTDAAATALRPVLAMLLQHTGLHLAIVAHAERAGGDALARRRADAVKWHLIDRGVAEDRVETRVGPVAATPLTFELAAAP